MMISNCPRCNESFRVPAGELPEDAYAECPWCLEIFPVSDVLERLPPVLGVMGADGQPLNLSLQVASARFAEQQLERAEPGLGAVDSRGPEREQFEEQAYAESTSTAPPYIDDHATDSADMHRSTDESQDVIEVDTDTDDSWGRSTADEDDDLNFQIREPEQAEPEAIAPMRVSPLPPTRGRKKSNAKRLFISYAIGGGLALPLTWLILMGLGLIGIGPYAGQADTAPRRAAAPVDLREPMQPQGQPLSLSDERFPTMEPDPADAAREQIVGTPAEENPIAVTPDAIDSDTTGLGATNPSTTDLSMTDPGGFDPGGFDSNPLSLPPDKEPVAVATPSEIDPSAADPSAADPSGPLMLPTDGSPETADAGQPRFVMPELDQPPVETPAVEEPTTVAQPEPVTTTPADTSSSPPATPDPLPPTELDLTPPSDPGFSPEPAPPAPVDSAETIETAEMAGKMIDVVSTYDGPDGERIRRLLLTYEKIATACGLATKESEAIRTLAAKIKDSSIRGEVESFGTEWLNYGKRTTEGVALIGKPSAPGEAATITLEGGRVVSVVGQTPLPSAAKVLAMGKIVEGGSAVELVHVEPMP